MNMASSGMPTDFEQKEKKIDNSQFEPISHKKTLTLINYFILNTSQFLNSFSNVTEQKIHDVDEKLDKLETLISLFEQKLDSLPEECFEAAPEGEAVNTQSLPMTQQMNPVLAPTENPLMAAGANPKMQVSSQPQANAKPGA